MSSINSSDILLLLMVNNNVPSVAVESNLMNTANLGRYEASLEVVSPPSKTYNCGVCR